MVHAEYNDDDDDVVQGLLCDSLLCVRVVAWCVAHWSQLSLAIPPWVGTVSSDKSWGVNRHTTIQCSNREPWSCGVNWFITDA